MLVIFFEVFISNIFLYKYVQFMYKINAFKHYNYDTIRKNKKGIFKLLSKYILYSLDKYIFFCLV